jgi:sensor histidine kinase regulating citrate/malate metabolism
MEELRQAVSIILMGSIVCGIVGMIVGCWILRPPDRRAMNNVEPVKLKKKVPIRKSPCESVYAGDMLADLKAMYQHTTMFHVPSNSTHALISKPIAMN